MIDKLSIYKIKLFFLKKRKKEKKKKKKKKREGREGEVAGGREIFTKF